MSQTSFSDVSPDTRVSPNAAARPSSAILHALAWLTAATTFPLIFMGGLVTSHQAGMSVPDWPNSYGYNMFLFPPRLWIGGIFYEHTHRLAATVVGFLAILLAFGAFFIERRPWVRRLCYGVLAGVIFQGILGGLRVVLVKLDLAMLHACVAQAFFCLTAMAVVVTGRWWPTAPDLGRSSSNGRTLKFLAAIALTAIYLQLIVAAVMRHNDAGLAIPDFPLSFGHLIPPTELSPQFRLAAMHQWPDPQLHLGHVTLFQIWIQFAHRVGAVVVSTAIFALAAVIFRAHRDEPKLVRPAVLLLVLLATQITLGIVTVLLRKPADVASAHVAVGALVLVTAFVTLLRSLRLYRRDDKSMRISPSNFSIPRQPRFASFGANPSPAINPSHATVPAVVFAPAPVANDRVIA